MNKLSKDEVKHIADLAKIELSEQELDKISAEFNAILNYVSQINECDVSDIVEEHNLQDFNDKVLRKDEVDASRTLSHKNLEQNATKNRFKNGYVVVKRARSEE